MRMLWASCLAFLLSMLVFTTSGASQTPEEPVQLAQNQTHHAVQLPNGELEVRSRINNWTVTILSSSINGTHVRMAADLQMALDDGDNMRVLPVLGRGAKQNVLDLLYLKGIDIAYTYADVFDEFKRDEGIRNIEQRIQYISVGHVSALNILVRPEIKTLKDLEGKKFGVTNGVSVAAKNLFSRLGVKIEPVKFDPGILLEKVKNGECAGMLHLLPKGHEFLTKIPPEHGLHLLNVEYDDRFADYYLPYTIDPGTYPNLMKPGEEVNTIAVPAVLAVYNWPRDTDRYRRVERFVEYYFSRFDRLKKSPHQPEWRNISLGAKVPGWIRFSAAEEMLEKIQKNKAPAASAGSAQRQPTNETATVEPDSSQEQLFGEFLEWKKRNGRQ